MSFLNKNKKMTLTNDKIIRTAYCKILEKDLRKYRKKSGHSAEIFEELGVKHGTARIDIAVINGIMHGYEIKSDKDTLQRLPEQMCEYNKVFDKITLIVGKNHLHEAIKIIPDWWGITLAKVNSEKKVVFYPIREEGENPKQDFRSIARLLWREEALQILEERNNAKGIRSKQREVIYCRLENTLDLETLKNYVRNTLLLSREDWRSNSLSILNGG